MNPLSLLDISGLPPLHSPQYIYHQLLLDLDSPPLSRHSKLRNYGLLRSPSKPPSGLARPKLTAFGHTANSTKPAVSGLWLPRYLSQSSLDRLLLGLGISRLRHKFNPWRFGARSGRPRRGYGPRRQLRMGCGHLANLPLRRISGLPRRHYQP